MRLYQIGKWRLETYVVPSSCTGEDHPCILMHLQSPAQKETQSRASQDWVSARGGGQRRPPRLCKEPLDADSIVVPPEARVEFLHARPVAQGNTLLSAQEAREGVPVRITRRESYFYH